MKLSALLIAFTAAVASAQTQLGVDTTHFDRSVRPQDDFYRFVNGGWLARTQIPADRSSYGSFLILADKSDDAVLAIAHDAANAHAPNGSAQQKIGDFYRAYMDTAWIEKAGVTPLKPELDRINAMLLPSQLPAAFARLRRLGVGLPFVTFVNQDAKNATQYALYVAQPRLGMPDRDYYLRDDQKFADTRAKYVAYIAKVMSLAKQPNPDTAAAHIMALETAMAKAEWTRVQNRNRDSTYNKMSVAQLQQRAPGLDWSAYLNAAGAPVDSVIVSQPSYVAAMSDLLKTVPLADWKSYLAFNTITTFAPLLSNDFYNAYFDFNGRTLAGQQVARPRERRAVRNLEVAEGELIGQQYVQRYFSPQTKARMLELVHNLQRSFDVGIDSLDWMSPATKTAAHDKLSKFTIKIGYPDTWKSYATLVVTPTDPVANSQRATAMEYDRTMARLGRPVDRTLWGMSPQTVNAYYNPTMNEIVFPAAIIQPPFYNPAADDAVNYGGIGAVIGHEMSHAFDDQGRKSDGEGNLRDWWTSDDAQKFMQRAEALATQYDTYSPVAGMHVNGHQTLGENIGDLSGLAIAYRAYRMSLNGKEAPVIDGFTGDQRFFMGFAQIWADLEREDAARQQLLVDVHSPDQYRGLGPLVNFTPFYAAWNVQPGDKMYKPEGERIRIW